MSEPKQFTPEVDDHIEELIRQIKRQNSFIRKFFMGIIGGVGTAIGATIVASTVIFVLAQVIKTVDDIPVLGNVMKSSSLQSTIELSVHEN